MKGSGPLYAALAGGGLLAVIAIMLAVGGGEPDPARPGPDTAPPAATPAQTGSQRPALTAQADPPPSPQSTGSQATGSQAPSPQPSSPQDPSPQPRPEPSMAQPAPQAALRAPEKTVSPLPAASGTDEREAAAESPEPAPRFDIVRVSPAGDMVIAGRAEPNSQVQILDKGEAIGAARADDRGEWVFLPSEQLAPGNRELTLSTVSPGGDHYESDRSVIIMVPDVPEAGEAGEAAQTASGEAVAPVPIIVSTPRAASASPDMQILQAPEINHESPLTVDLVEYDSEGQIGVAGRAEPETAVRIYVNDRPAGESPADDTGQWRIEPPRDLPPGLYRLRADQVAPTGEVVARVELPFVKEELAALPQTGQTYVVQPGNSLWRIARARYGSGFQYIVIYQSNRSQIRDPDLIYPGQVLDIPGPGY